MQSSYGCRPGRPRGLGVRDGDTPDAAPLEIRTDRLGVDMDRQLVTCGPVGSRGDTTR
jgi:hypothetical protein